MNVSNYLAQNIVEDIKEIINQDINYFDSNGIIIASTNKERIGLFHGGAKIVLESKDDLIIRYEGQYKGTREGINLPVYFQNEIVGVIGITGEKEEVEKYGKIIKKMTEILIMGGYIQEQERIDRESKRQFIEELLFRYHSDDRSILARAELLDIPINTNRIVMIGRIIESNDEFILTPTINEKIFKFMEKQIRYDNENLIAQKGMSIIIIHKTRSRENMETIIRTIQNTIEKQYNIKVYFGIGEPCDNIIKIRKSYREAKKALDIGIAVRSKDIIYYKDLNIGLLIDDIPRQTINKYLNRVFNNMEKDEINEFSKLMDAYIKHNGSITKAADELFIHKNTLQYRLNKLKILTGFDPRNIANMVVLYLAFTLYRFDFDK